MTALLQGLAIAALAASTAATAQPLPTGKRLKDIQSKALIGGFMNFCTINNYVGTVGSREFNVGQSGDQTWGSGLNQFDFSTTNDWTNFIKTKGMKVWNCQCWFATNQYYPAWFGNGTWTATQLDQQMQDFTRAFFASNGNATKIDYCVAVNECLDLNSNAAAWGYFVGNWYCKWYGMGLEADMSGLTGADKVFTQVPVYIRRAFVYMRQHTNAKLELRDRERLYTTDFNFRPAYQLLKHLKNTGAPVDAFGEQMHVTLDGNQHPPFLAVLRSNIGKVRDLGYEVYISELDIGLGSYNNDAGLQMQKTWAYDIYKTCIEAGCALVSIWNLADNIDPGWRYGERCSMFDANFAPKPFYYGAQQALTDIANASTGLSNPPLYGRQTGLRQSQGTRPAGFCMGPASRTAEERAQDQAATPTGTTVAFELRGRTVRPAPSRLVWLRR